jgi:hypothetical protein
MAFQSVQWVGWAGKQRLEAAAKKAEEEGCRAETVVCVIAGVPTASVTPDERGATASIKWDEFAMIEVCRKVLHPVLLARNDVQNL